MNDKNREFTEIIQLFFVITHISDFEQSNKPKIFLKYPLVQFQKNCNFVVSAIKGRYQSGQMEQTVNLPASPSEVRILPCPHNCEHFEMRE